MSARVVLASVTGAAVLTALVAVAPAYADVAPSCGDARLALTQARAEEDSSALALDSAQRADVEARARLSVAVTAGLTVDAAPLRLDLGNGTAVQARANVTVADTSLVAAQRAEVATAANLARARRAVSEACSTDTSASPVVIYKVINGKRCKRVNNTWVPVESLPTPASTTSPPAPAPVVVQPAPDTNSGGYSQVREVPSGPVDTGDGSLAPR